MILFGSSAHATTERLGGFFECLIGCGGPPLEEGTVEEQGRENSFFPVSNSSPAAVFIYPNLIYN
jgi:hypothetical protein